MSFYSPFTDKNGNFISIDKVKYSNLPQLFYADEGYKLEYKETWNSNVEKKIPDIITSFANSEGGWIIIGIVDNSKEIRPIPKIRADYSQKISQLIKPKVSPTPGYETKFLNNPKNKSEGVLLIYVYEGIFTPYISNGTVYIRNGSSKDPQPAGRASIEFLFSKAKTTQKDTEKFCHREIFYPINDEEKGIKYPICNIFLKNLSTQNDNKLSSYSERKIISEKILDGTGIFTNMQYSMNSMIFYHSYKANLGITVIWELFFDYSSKFYLPLSYFEPTEKAKALTEIFNLCDNTLFLGDKDINIIDGTIWIAFIDVILEKYNEILKSHNIKYENLVLCLEVENALNSVLYFDSNKYKDRIKTNGLNYVNKVNNKSNLIYLKDSNMRTYTDIKKYIAFDLFSQTFGYEPNILYDIWLQSISNKRDKYS
nr:ATP-binding protein [uncultured Anaerocolumna sp.]